MYAIIGTWKMVRDSLFDAHGLLSRGASAGDAVVRTIRPIEDDPRLMSVGYGGLPDREGHVTLDSAYMDGKTLRLGAVLSAEGIASPILAARALCGRRTDFVLSGQGAERFAREQGLEMRDMRTEACLARWRERLSREDPLPGAYRGHDTVCVLALDETGDLVAGCSTSGLFMKAPGRVGDTPLVGSGFYADARWGAAAATGLGEEIMRGCLSYEAVSLMRRGASPREACEEAVRNHAETLKSLGESPDGISLIALSPKGEFGAATTLPLFPFAAGNDAGAALYAARAYTSPDIHEASEEEVSAID